MSDTPPLFSDKSPLRRSTPAAGLPPYDRVEARGRQRRNRQQAASALAVLAVVGGVGTAVWSAQGGQQVGTVPAQTPSASATRSAPATAPSEEPRPIRTVSAELADGVYCVVFDPGFLTAAEVQFRPVWRLASPTPPVDPDAPTVTYLESQMDVSLALTRDATLVRNSGSLSDPPETIRVNDISPGDMLEQNQRADYGHTITVEDNQITNIQELVAKGCRPVQ